MTTKTITTQNDDQDDDDDDGDDLAIWSATLWKNSSALTMKEKNDKWKLILFNLVI